MRIKRLTIRNIKCLSFVDISPKGSVIEIHGKNAAGKSSIIDSILMGLLGKKAFGELPIKHGEKSGEINLETDDGYKINCQMRIADKSGNLYNKLTVMDKHGELVAKPQEHLDKWLAGASLDPSDFMEMKPGERIAFLQKALGVKEQFDKLDRDYSIIFEKRKVLGKENTKMVGRLMPYEDLPDEGVDAEKNQFDIDGTMKKIGEIDKLYERQADEAELSRKESEAVDELRKQYDQAREDWHQSCEWIKDEEAKMERIKREIAKLKEDKTAHAKTVAEIKQELTEAEGRRSQGFTVPKEKIAEKDALKKKLEKLYSNTQQSEQIAVKHRLQEEKRGLEKDILECTDNLQQIKEARKELLRQTKFPVEGMAFGDEDLEMNGIPFNSASSAERILMSVVLNSAIDSKIKIIKIADGSLLDDASMVKLESVAEEKDLQVWVETVERENYGDVFRLEEGRVKEEK